MPDKMIRVSEHTQKQLAEFIKAERERAELNQGEPVSDLFGGDEVGALAFAVTYALQEMKKGLEASREISENGKRLKEETKEKVEQQRKETRDEHGGS